MNKMQDKAIEMLDSMRTGSFGDDVRPALPSFTAGMLAAMCKQDWNKVLSINEMMMESGTIQSNTTLQCVLLANMQNGNTEALLQAMENAINSEMVIDVDTFLFCAKILLPNNNGDGGVDSIRNEMRKLANNSPDVAETAMSLNKTLRECYRQDQRRPSNMSSKVAIQQERDQLWRDALTQTIQLSKIL